MASIFLKPKPVTTWEIFNWICAITFDVFIYLYFGDKALTYLLASTFLGHGLHPSAGHFVAEHFAFGSESGSGSSGQETFSYYGSLNYINFNVGYHVEHHDFPRVPWTKLPKLREIAKEYYDDLPSYTSYIYVLYTYIMDPTLGPMSRIKRRKQGSAHEHANAIASVSATPTGNGTASMNEEKKNYSFAIACSILGFIAFFFLGSRLMFGF